MSQLFLNDTKRSLEEDAALTEQRPRQSFQEDRSPDEDVMMDIETDESEQRDDVGFMFQGLVEAIKRRLTNE